MYTIGDLEITKLLPSSDGIYAYATYPSWSKRFSFFVKDNGTVMGQSSSGTWLEVSDEMAESITAKVHTLLANKPARFN